MSGRARGNAIGDWYIPSRHRTKGGRGAATCFFPRGCRCLTQPVSLHYTVISKRPMLHHKCSCVHSNRSYRQQGQQIMHSEHSERSALCVSWGFSFGAPVSWRHYPASICAMKHQAFPPRKQELF